MRLLAMNLLLCIPRRVVFAVSGMRNGWRRCKGITIEADQGGKVKTFIHASTHRLADGARDVSAGFQRPISAPTA